MATKDLWKLDVNAEKRKLYANRKIFWYTSNKFGRVVLCTLERFQSMNKNRDTMSDANDITETFARLTDEEYKTITKATKSNDKKIKDKANAIIVEKVKQLTNFLALYKEWEIEDKKTGLHPDVIDLLADVQVESTTSLKDENAKLRAEIEAFKKANKTTKTKAKTTKEEDKIEPEVTDEPTKESEDDEDPFKD